MNDPGPETKKSNLRTLCGLVLAIVAAFFCVADLYQRCRRLGEPAEHDSIEAYVRRFAMVRRDLPKTVRVRYESTTGSQPIEKSLRDLLEPYEAHIEMAVELVRSERFSLAVDHQQLVQQLVKILMNLPPERRRSLSTDEAISLLTQYFAGLVDMSAVRYALAPHRVTQSENADYVVSESEPGSREGTSDLAIIKVYDNGVVLSRR